MRHGSIVTFNALLRHKEGVLSSLLASFCRGGRKYSHYKSEHSE